jgi:hypothetical protein
MGDLVGKIQSGRGLLQRIGAKIPGFRGYLERETRRGADKLLRDSITGRFEQQLRRLPDVQIDLVNSGRLEFVDDVERATMKLQTFVDRVKTTPRGYSGFYDAIKVNEGELEQLYDFDSKLLDEADKIAAAVDAVATAVGSSGDVGGAVRGLIGAATAINDLYSQREHVLLGSV